MNAPTTFSTKAEAETWIGRQRADIVDGVVRPKRVASKVTLRQYAEDWLDERRNKNGEPLRPSTRRVYEIYLRSHINPVLGDLPLAKITPTVVREWYRETLRDRPTLRARTYSLLHAILATAVDDERDLIGENPCKIRGAGGVRAATKKVVASPAQVAQLAAAVPDRLALAILLGAWCSTRSGEVLELRRQDITTSAVSITRAVNWVDGQAQVGPPKTDAGIRVIAVPPHLADAVTRHLDTHVGEPPSALLFPSKARSDVHLHSSTFAYYVKQAVERTSLPRTFRYHHLRHSGLTWAGQAGATPAELQARAGHSSSAAMLMYQHATTVRDQALAAALSRLAE